MASPCEVEVIARVVEPIGSLQTFYGDEIFAQYTTSDQGSPSPPSTPSTVRYAPANNAQPVGSLDTFYGDDILEEYTSSDRAPSPFSSSRSRSPTRSELENTYAAPSDDAEPEQELPQPRPQHHSTLPSFTDPMWWSANPGYAPMMRQKQQMNKAAEKMPLSLGELFYSDPPTPMERAMARPVAYEMPHEVNVHLPRRTWWHRVLKKRKGDDPLGWRERAIVKGGPLVLRIAHDADAVIYGPAQDRVIDSSEDAMETVEKMLQEIRVMALDAHKEGRGARTQQIALRLDKLAAEIRE